MKFQANLLSAANDVKTLPASGIPRILSVRDSRGHLKVIPLPQYGDITQPQNAKEV